MKILKKILKIAGITLLSLMLLAFIIPVVFKKQVQALVKREINKNLNAKVDFTDVKLSLFRHFPKATITIKGLSIVGRDVFAKDTLIAADKIDVTAGLFSVLKGTNIKVYGLYLHSPRIHILVKENGLANYDIVKKKVSSASSSDTSASDFKITLKKYSMTNGYLVYDDKQANTYTEINGLQHQGSGDLTADLFTLSTSTQAASANFVQDGIPYLIDTKTDITTDIKIDNKTHTYTFKTDDIVLNSLKLSADGFIQMVNNSTFNMDFRFKSPSNDFKDILSMIPAVYKKDFASIKTSGQAVFNGFVKGTFSPQQMPAYDMNLEVKNGSFQYPDLPKPVKNIQLSLQASNADGKPDNAVVDISKGHLEMDNEPFDFRFIYKNPVTTEWIDAAAKGKLDLSQLSKFIKLSAGPSGENGTILAGLVWADAFVKGPLKAIQQQAGAFSAGGFFDIKNLYYTDNNFPQPIKNGHLKATLENSGGIADKTVINVSAGHIEVGNDPVDFSLQVRNPVSSVDFSGHAKGNFTLDHIKQFTKLDPGTSIRGVLDADLGFAGTKTAINQKQYDKIMLNGTAGLTNLKYHSGQYPSGITISSTQLVFNQKNVTVSNLSGNYLNTNFTATGVLNNLAGYALQEQALTGNLKVNADKINLNDWLGTTANTSTSTSTTTAVSGKPFLVPANLTFTVNALANQVKYDKVDYNNISGTLVMNDEKLTLQNIKTEALDGSILINGSYSTKINKTKPDISLSYDIKNMDVQKAFSAYNTSQALMPVGKFLAGKLSSQLSLTGNLYGSMMPILNSLSGKGNLLLIQGVLKNFAPLEKMAMLLQIDRLKSISVRDIKNYFEFANGKVMVKPFTIKIDSIEMLISGFHGFDQSIDYAIKMKLPRKILGAKGNNLINNLVADATSRGLPFKLGETINLDIRMTGTISNPFIGISLKGTVDDVVKDMEQQAKDFLQAKLDSARQKAKDSLQAVKKQIEDKLIDKLKEQIFGKDSTSANNNLMDSTQKNPGQTIKKTLKDLFNIKKKPVKDSMQNP